jgi:hypothetical protein
LSSRRTPPSPRRRTPRKARARRLEDLHKHNRRHVPSHAFPSKDASIVLKKAP